jgi:hypothetical protein
MSELANQRGFECYLVADISITDEVILHNYHMFFLPDADS